MPRIAGAVSRQARRLAACIAMLMVSPGGAPALEWTTLPTVSLSTRHDDNYRLAVDDERDVRRRQLEARAGIAAADEGFEFRLSPRFVALEFDDEREKDRHDEYLDLGLLAADERNRWTFDAGLANEGTLTSEFQETGFTEVDIDSMTTRLATAWTSTPNERSQYVVSFGRRNVSYEQRFLSPLVDYRYTTFSLSFVRALSAKSSVEISGYDTNLHSESATGTTKTSGATAAWVNRFSPTLEGRIGAGLYRVRSQIPLAPFELRADLAPSLDLSLTKAGSAWAFTAGLKVDSQPSAYGVMYRHETLRLDWGWQLSSSLALTFRAQLADVAAEEGAYSARDRTYGQGGVTVDWRVAERTSVFFGLDSRAQEYQTSRRARAAAVFVGFVYRGTGIRT